jgi:hypothetical protein
MAEEDQQGSYEDVTIHEEDRPILKMALEAALELFAHIKKCNEHHKKYEYKPILNELVIKYQILARRFPLVLQHMCMTQQFNAKLFAKFMIAVRENSEKTKNEREMIKLQAKYEVEYLRIQHAEGLQNGTITERNMRKAYEDIKQMYYEQLDKRNESHRTIKEEIERTDREVKRILIEGIKNELISK